MPTKKPKSLNHRLSITILLIFVVLISILGGALGDRLLGYKVLDRWFPSQQISQKGETIIEQKVVKEESIVIDVVERVSDSVVTVGVKKTQLITNPFENFFDPFGFFGLPQPQAGQQEEQIEQDIGSGFVISKEGMIVTNKHVVADTEAEYRVITKDDQEYKVTKIFRDPSIDLAILQVSAKDLKPVELGDSEKLKVGQ
ncbi:MAG TPA: trypsin-like peptidase domain-containing protein, partial [Candidatus Bathyarchaeia archaeon]|nr:trypsin-like peptidase domain-containing protein [Candidatus Bathyarchaeia archaeon]